MPVRSKSIYEAAAPEDGHRILATNYWPRGVSKERAGTYVRELGPSRELLRAYRDGAVSWSEYETAYLAEMKGQEQQEGIARLAALARGETVTVMCICKDEARCHRRLLRELIAQAM